MSKSDEKPKKRPTGLGRGLSSLLGEVEKEAPVEPANAEPDEGAVQLLALSQLTPHPDQPRRHFDDAALGELAKSIKERGVIQPIVVRPQPGSSGYQIVAGERRWRAAQKAQLHQVPCIVRAFNDAETLEIALVENIQREDLNAIEEAEVYQRLIEDFGHSQAALARLVHKSRSHVANLLRMLELPRSVREMVIEAQIEMGHARAIISAPNAAELARRIVSEGLSVRAAESLAREAKAGTRKAPPKQRDADILALERRLGEALGLKVRIDHKGRGGSVKLDYANLDQLDFVCLRLSGGNF